MNVTGLLRQSFDDVHREIRSNLAELPEGSLWWQPAPGMNHIGFLLWHLVRDEDPMIAGMTGRTQVWSDGGWGGRAGLHALSEVATLEPTEADGLRFETVPVAPDKSRESLASDLGVLEGLWREKFAGEPLY